MQYVTCGAYVNGERPKTKKALKDAMKETPAKVVFDKTSLFDCEGDKTIRGNALHDSVTINVVGPDPYHNRKWYATVTANGKVT